MLRYTTYIQQQAIRFRRWGRAGYSAFRSMLRVVTIGRLTVSVSDKAMLKAKSGRIVSSSTHIIFSDLIADLFALEEEINEQNLICQLLPVNVQDTYAAAHTLHTIKYYKRLKRYNLLFNRFFVNNKLNSKQL